MTYEFYKMTAEQIRIEDNAGRTIAIINPLEQPEITKEEAEEIAIAVVDFLNGKFDSGNIQ